VDEAGYWEGFKSKWGAMGIIPKNLSLWLQVKAGISSKETLNVLIGQMQLDILNASNEAWLVRRKA